MTKTILCSVVYILLFIIPIRVKFPQFAFASTPYPPSEIFAWFAFDGTQYQWVLIASKSFEILLISRCQNDWWAAEQESFKLASDPMIYTKSIFQGLVVFFFI